MSVILGLGMIVKDEVEDLERILKDYSKYFDEIQITITNESKRKELEDICKKYGAESSYFNWVNDFSAARNFNKDQFKRSEYYFRLDCDDSIINPERIRTVVEKTKENNASIVFCFYDYSRDDNGNTNAAHYRETVIKNDKNLYWNKKIHENILPKSTRNYYTAIDNSIKIFHHITKEKSYESAIRNIKYLLEEYNQDKENPDPRTMAYLGRMFHGVGQLDEGIFFLERHIQNSGWDEDRYYSWCCLADIFMRKNDYRKAISCCTEAIIELPEWPDAYLKLHDVYFETGKWKQAIEWGKMGFSKEPPTTLMITDPSSRTWRPMLSMSMCYFQLGEFDKALKLFLEAKKYVPKLNYVIENEKLFRDGVTHKKIVDAYAFLIHFMYENDKEKIEPLLKSIPKQLNDHEILYQIKNKLSPPKVWPKKSVVIYSGKVFEPWADPSVETGIGGSEEAVVYLSRELTKRGYQVTVFNECGDMEGVYNGVTYVNYYKFNPNDTFDVIISWRSNVFDSREIKANKRWIWLHDILVNGWLSDPEETKNVDKVLVLSQYHKSLLPPCIPEEKILITANGINPEEYKPQDVERNPKRVIYGSSYDRGLEELLKIWPDVKKEVPEAELHVFYGVGNLVTVAKEQEWAYKLLGILDKELKQPGVFNHGRVGHKELITEYMKSGVWCYPCKFPEIYCITAVKAQMCGCVPVTTDYAAVKEIVKSGIVVPGKGDDPETLQLLKERLISVLKDTEYQESLRQNTYTVCKDQTWGAVAEQWIKEFK